MEENNEMDIDEFNMPQNPKCYKCVPPVWDKLSIIHSTNHILLWNKYQLLLYDIMDLETPINITPQFTVKQIVFSEDNLALLDFAGNLHYVHLENVDFRVTPSVDLALNIGHQPRLSDVVTCIKIDKYLVLSLIKSVNAINNVSSPLWCLSLNRINSEFSRELLLELQFKNKIPKCSSAEKCLLTNRTVYDSDIKTLKVTKTGGKIYELTVMTFNKLSIYWCLFTHAHPNKYITVSHLYTCADEICNMEIVKSEGLYLLIGLKIGVVIKLSMTDQSQPPQIAYLNTALHKILCIGNSLFYTDGVTMWKSEKTFTKSVILTQLIVANTCDFTVAQPPLHDDLFVICTTFSQSIFVLPLMAEESYVAPKATDYYSSAENLFSNQDYFSKICEMINKNSELVKKINSEQNYITALALHNKGNVVNRAIESSIQVYENYYEVDKSGLTLTEDMNEYFELETWLFLISISFSNMHSCLDSVFTHLLNHIKIHITLSSQNAILKTTSLDMMKQFSKKVKFLIPLRLNIKHIWSGEINVKIEIIVTIPKALEEKRKMWSCLYRKTTLLSSEHFIKTNKENNEYLKRSKESLEDLIHKACSLQHGSNFYSKSVDNEEHGDEWSFYVNLPNNYEEIFNPIKYCEKHFNSTRAEALVQQFCAKDFIKAKKQIFLTIGYEKLRISIQNDGLSQPFVKVTGRDLQMVFNIRNFFSHMIYNDYEGYGPGKIFTRSHFYDKTKQAQELFFTSDSSEVLTLIEDFEKYTIGLLPV